MLNISKWLNTISIRTTDPNAITTITSFPFVQSVSGIAARWRDDFSDKYDDEEIVDGGSANRPGEITGDFFNYGTNSFNEINIHNGQFLHNIGLRGQTVQIAMLDNGFNNYTSPSFDAFDSANANNQVLGTWDFVANEQNVANDGSHGMSCFSTIVANIPGQFIGMAPKAKFWLYQTEDNASEYPIEEHNWVCGAERADSSGADVISTSLGYGDQMSNPSYNHTYAEMDGNTTIAARGADLAAKKGMLVFAAAGNEGNSSWHYLITPADGDSVVAVGAVNINGVVGSFSSYGPSSDGQIKPDIASVGVSALIQNSGGGISFSNGTSFACPKMAGLGSCLWQGFPEFNNMKIVQAMRQAGNRASNPNDRIGYGIPDMKKAFSNLLIEYATSTVSVNNCSVTLNWNSKDMSAMKYEVERKAPGDTGYIKINEMNPQAGNILTNRSYQFTNILSAVSAGTISYRIRQIIDTAAASFAAVYIDTANVSLASDCIALTPTADRVRVVPNPAPAQATLEVETSYAVADMPVNIYDTKGRLMHKMRLSKGIGKATFPLPIERFAEGTYYISVYNGEKLIGTSAFLKL